MPKVNASVKAKFPEGTPFGMGLFPDEAVAIGATTQAFLLQVTWSAASGRIGRLGLMHAVYLVHAMREDFALVVAVCAFEKVLFSARNTAPAASCMRVFLFFFSKWFTRRP